MSQITEAATPLPRKKPRFALLLATGFGLGYLPKAPGTWGSLGGVAIYWVFVQLLPYVDSRRDVVGISTLTRNLETYAILVALPAIAFILVGLWFGGRVARYAGQKDPQFVVVDEVCGQFLTYAFSPALIDWKVVNWKYLVAGFILFRVFDIWKPFPARQAEMLPGGWGIMADDWVAAIYAALGLWLARALGL